MGRGVPNFLSYVSAKYYLNWFTVGNDIVKIKSVNFLLRHSVESDLYTVSQKNIPTFLAITPESTDIFL